MKTSTDNNNQTSDIEGSGTQDKVKPFNKTRLALMFAVEHDLPVEMYPDEVNNILTELQRLQSENARLRTALKEIAYKTWRGDEVDKILSEIETEEALKGGEG